MEEVYQASKKHISLRGASAGLQMGYMLPLLDAYVKAGETTKFTDLMNELLVDARTTLPKDSPQLAGLLAQFSLSLLEQKIEQKMSMEAESLLRECLVIRENSLPNDWLTSNTKSMLGAALLDQKKYEEAEKLLLVGYQGMKEKEKTIPPKGQIRLTEALKRLVELHESIDKPDKAAKWQAELDNRQEENDFAKAAPKGSSKDATAKPK